MGLPQNKKLYKSLPKNKKSLVAGFLRNVIKGKSRTKIQEAIKKDPENWVAEYHSVWGRGIRNILRDNGYGEKYFKVKNLDDIYAELVEDALRE